MVFIKRHTYIVTEGLKYTIYRMPTKILKEFEQRNKDGNEKRRKRRKIQGFNICMYINNFEYLGRFDHLIIKF